MPNKNLYVGGSGNTPTTSLEKRDDLRKKNVQDITLNSSGDEAPLLELDGFVVAFSVESPLH